MTAVIAALGAAVMLSVLGDALPIAAGLLAAARGDLDGAVQIEPGEPQPDAIAHRPPIG